MNKIKVDIFKSYRENVKDLIRQLERETTNEAQLEIIGFFNLQFAKYCYEEESKCQKMANHLNGILRKSCNEQERFNADYEIEQTLIMFGFQAIDKRPEIDEVNTITEPEIEGYDD
jgi:hypothetical protein